MADFSLDDLPTWMRPRRRLIDWGLLVILAFSALAALPFLIHPGLPHHTDADLFIARSVQVAEVLRSGTLYSRWAPDFNFGLGSPLFNYLAPLPHYVSGFHQLVTDADPVDSIKLLFCLSMIGAGVGMFVFARGRWGASVAVLCALVYLFSPPILLVLPYQVGDLASLMSLGLLPWALYALDRWAAHKSGRELLFAATALALWALADVRLMLVGLLVIAVTILSSQHWRHALLPFGISALLTAFFWLPALVERAQITWIRLADDPHGGGIPLTEVFGAIPPPDPILMNPPLYRGLGSGIAVIGALGLLAIVYGARQHTSLWRDAIAFASVGGVFLLIASPTIAGLWAVSDDWQPLLPYHLLIGGTLFCLAVVAGQAACWLEWLLLPRWRSFGLALLCALALLAAAPSLSLSTWAADPAINPQSESAIHAIASLRDGLLLPTTAYQPSESLSSLALNTPKSSDLTKRNFGLSQVERTPLASRFTANLDQVQTMKFDRYMFPGWYVTVDGAQREAESGPQGLVAATLPAPAREVTIWFGSTTVRSLSWLITIIGGMLLVWGWRRSRHTAVINAPLVPTQSSFLALWGLFALFGVFSVAIWLRPDSATAPSLPPATSLVRFTAENTEIGLSMFHVDTRTIHAGDTMQATLYWQAARPLDVDYQLEAKLIRETDHQAAGQIVEWRPGGIPSSQWLPGYYVRDVIQIRSALWLAPGAYDLEISLGQCTSQQTLPCDKPTLLQATQPGKAAGDSALLPQPISVVAP